MYDQIIISGAFLNDEGPITCNGEFKVFKPQYMCYKQGSNKGAPRPTYGKRSRYLGGYSDHFPVEVKFNYRRQKIDVDS